MTLRGTRRARTLGLLRALANTVVVELYFRISVNDENAEVSRGLSDVRLGSSLCSEKILNTRDTFDIKNAEKWAEKWQNLGSKFIRILRGRLDVFPDFPMSYPCSYFGDKHGTLLTHRYVDYRYGAKQSAQTRERFGT